MSQQTPPPRQGQRVRFDLDDDGTATYTGSSSEEHSGSNDEMGSGGGAVMSNGSHRRRYRSDMRRDHNDEDPPTRSILQVGSISVLMLLFVTVSVAHLTMRYNSLETNPVVPNFPDHLNSHNSYLRGKENTNGGTGTLDEMSSLITADDKHDDPVIASHAGSIIVPIQEDAEEGKDDETEEATAFDSDGESQSQVLDAAVEDVDDQETEGSDYVEDFDMYLFTMSYQPEFCHSHHSSAFPGCMTPNMNYTTHLTIHGLWPERSSGSYPQYCQPGKAELDPEVIQELASQFTRFWPDEKNPHMEDPTQMMEFYAHEWAKHGTCTNLTQMEYFSAAFDAYIVPDPPTIIQDFYGQEVSTTKLQAAFEQLAKSPLTVEETSLSSGDKFVVGLGGLPREQEKSSSVVLICSGHKYLEEIRICLSNEGGAPGKTIPCPDAVVETMARDKCQGDTVMLSKFKESVTSSVTGAGSSDSSSKYVSAFVPMPVADKYTKKSSLSHLPFANDVAMAHNPQGAVNDDPLTAHVYYATEKKMPRGADEDEEPSMGPNNSFFPQKLPMNKVDDIPILSPAETEDNDIQVLSVDQDEDDWESSLGETEKSNGDALMM